jgi:hypothetical protein
MALGNLMSNNNQEIRDQLTEVVSLIQAIPAGAMDEEDLEISEGLLAMAGAHQTILTEITFSKLSDLDRTRHLDQAKKFCEEVSEIMQLANAHIEERKTNGPAGEEIVSKS